MAEKDLLLDTVEKAHDNLSTATRGMANDLIAAKEEATSLFNALGRKDSVLAANSEALRELCDSMCARIARLEEGMTDIQQVMRTSHSHTIEVLDDFMARKENEVGTLKEALASMSRAVEQSARQASENACKTMQKHADMLEQMAMELRAGANATADSAVQAVVASKRGCDETMESLQRSLASDRAAFSNLAETVAATSERGVADFMSKHVRDLSSIREQMSSQFSAAVKYDSPTGTTPARDTARVMLAEPVTPSAFSFSRDDVLERRRSVDAKRSTRPPLSPIGGSSIN